jgi:hypothetical protein
LISSVLSVNWGNGQLKNSRFSGLSEITVWQPAANNSLSSQNFPIQRTAQHTEIAAVTYLGDKHRQLAMMAFKLQEKLTDASLP